MHLGKEIEVAKEITGEELIPASCIDENGKESFKAIPVSLLKGDKGEKGDPGPQGKDGYVTKEMYEELVKRIEALENSNVENNKQTKKRGFFKWM